MGKICTETKVVYLPTAFEVLLTYVAYRRKAKNPLNPRLPWGFFAHGFFQFSGGKYIIDTTHLSFFLFYLFTFYLDSGHGHDFVLPYSK